MSEHKEPIPSMIYNAAVGGHVTNSQQIIDENLNREQNDINQETVGAVPYNAATPNGMGRIVLKKNDNFKQVVEAQTNGNTIFVIKYDFILTSDVTIPNNCILEFDGGSISGNYTFTFFNTLLCGVIKLYTRFNGTVLNKYFNVDDFSNTDDITNALQDIVNITNVVFSKKDYITTKQIDVPNNRYIRGVNGTKIYNETSNTINIIGDNVTIEGISFESKSTETFAQYIIYVRPTHTDINIHHCNFEKATGGIFTEYEVQNMRVSDCVFDNMAYVQLGGSDGAGGYGICISHKDEEDDYTWGGKDLIFTNNTFKEGVYRHCFYIQSCENVIISNNIMYGKNQQTYSGYDVAINVRGSKNLTIQSNILNNGHALYNCTDSKYYGQPSNIIIKDNSINNTQEAVYRDLGAIHAIGKNYLIDGNVFNDTGKYDIRIDDAKEVTISNNIMNKSVANVGVMILSDSKDIDIVNNSFNGHSVAVKVYGGTMNNISICHNRMNVENYDISFEHYSIVQHSKMIIDENIGYREFQIVELTELNKLELLRITNNQFKMIPSLSNLTIDAIFIKGNSSKSHLAGGRNFGSSDIRPGYISDGINEIGFMYFNTTTGIPNFWNGTAWVDATGTQV